MTSGILGVMEQAIKRIIFEQYNLDIEPQITRPEPEFGDFSTNVAMQLAGRLGKNPREIAAEVAGALRQTGDYSKVDIAGPGFINLTVNDSALLGAALRQPARLLNGKIYVVEYSDPNPFKPLHAGHLYTTLVGDTIARLVENAGATTVRVNYGGDVGRHVAIAMREIIYRFGGEEQALEAMRLKEADDLHVRAAFLGDCYAKGTAAFEDDEAAKIEILANNKRVYELHEKDDHQSTFAQIYWMGRDWSYSYFKVLYQELDIKPFDRYIPESEVTPLGVATVRDQQQKGVYVASDGAVVFDGEAKGLHTRVFINSEGLPTYETKDVGLSLTKWRDYHFDQSVIITASEQSEYMKVVIASINEFEPEPARRTRHITHGIVKLAGGVKMSSRKGNVVTALDIIRAAREAAAAANPSTNESTVLAAIKYAFAKTRIGGDIIYSPTESVALEGNSGPYLQYAHARVCSILQKAGDVKTTTGGVAYDTAERALLRKLGENADIIERATRELMPHHVCTYLYELAQEFNRFYEQSRVIGDDRQALRLGLITIYRDTLKNGLDLLGIVAPEKM